MTTAFQTNAFQNNAFQINESPFVPTTGGIDGHYRKKLKRLELLTRTKDRNKLEEVAEFIEELEMELNIPVVKLDYSDFSDIPQMLRDQLALIENTIKMREQEMMDEEFILLMI